MALIRWIESTPASITAELGYVGTVNHALFRLVKPISRDDEWALVANLPGQEQRPSYSESQDELKSIAEDRLRSFVGALGAEFREVL